VTWEDLRPGTPADIYAQRIDASGVVQWTVDGVGLCITTRNQSSPASASDGAGGAIAVWEDERVLIGRPEAYAQRIDGSGAVQWATNGVALQAGLGPLARARFLAITPDGTRGAIAAWFGSRPGDSLGVHFRAQRVDASGVVKWTTNGVLLNNTSTTLQTTLSDRPSIVGDGAQGALVAFSDTRNNIDSDLFVQRVDSTGTMQWGPGGVGICEAAGHQTTTAMISDGAGGAFFAWQDPRNGSNDIYAQRVDASGAVQWSTDGVPVCTEANEQLNSKLVSDGAGGVIVTWNDNRSAPVEIYAQRLNGSGVPQWTPGGVLISVAGGGDELSPIIVSDGAGGAIVIWQGSILRAQRIDASGATLWPSGGVAVTSTSSAAQGAQVAFANGTGGALVAFTDNRSGVNDIYAQNLDSSGLIPTTGVGDAPLSPAFMLSPNWPNPFSIRTSMTLDLPVGSDVAVSVADVSGRIVRRMGLGYRSAGSTTMSFDGRDDQGQLLPHGVYFYSVRARGTTVTHKVEIVR